VISIAGGGLEIYEPRSNESREIVRERFNTNSKALSDLLDPNVPVILLDQGHYRLFTPKIDQ